MQQSKKSSDAPTIAIDQVEEVLAGSGQRGDALRAEGYRTLTQVKRAKLVQTRRERARVAARFGEQSPQVRRLDEKMAMEHRLLVGSRAEADRIKAPVLERSESSWQVHGYLRDQDGFPRAGYTVGLFPDDEGRESALLSTVTNSSGYFHLTWPPEGEKAQKVMAESAPQEVLHLMDGADSSRSEATGAATEEEVKSLESGLRINTNTTRARQLRMMAVALRKAVYLGGRGPGQKAPTMDPRALHPLRGAIVYRDLTIDDESDTGEQCHFATRLLGNSATRELHTLENEKKGCHLAAIRPDHRVYFLSEEQALKLGYDYCAYCYGKERSRR